MLSLEENKKQLLEIAKSERKITLKSIYDEGQDRINGFNQVKVRPAGNRQTRQIELGGYTPAKNSKTDYIPTSESSFLITNNKDVDFTYERNKIDWHWIVGGHNYIGLNKEVALAYNLPFYVKDEEVEAQISVTKRQKVFEAEKMIFEVSLKEKKQIATLLGIQVFSLSEMELTNILLEKASMNPDDLLNINKDEDKEHKLMISDLIEKGIVKFISGQYRYEEMLLANSKEAFIEYLKDEKNEPVVAQLRNLVKKK